MLGVAYSNLAQNKQSLGCLKKAYDLRERASEREKLYILAHYYGEGSREIEKSIAVYEQWRQTYPRDTIPADNLALLYAATNQRDKELSVASEDMRLAPKNAYAYQNVASAYLTSNRSDEAKAVAEQAVGQKLDSFGVRIMLYHIAFTRGDQDGMQRQVAWATGTANEAFMLSNKAGGEDSLGKIKVSRDTWRQAMAAANRDGLKEFASVIQAVQAIRDAAHGNFLVARERASEALKLSEDDWMRQIAALALAQSGETAKAQKLVEDLSKEFPSDTFLHAIQIPTVQAYAYLQGNKPAEAVAVLEAARRYELGDGSGNPGYLPVYARGQAFLRLHDGARAAAEFQKILDHRGVQITSELLPLSQLNLARAYVLQGDVAKARTAYQDFFAIWKDADPDIPVLKQAKAEYAKLQ